MIEFKKDKAGNLYICELGQISKISLDNGHYEAWKEINGEAPVDFTL
jgi:hypothetical protein